MRRSFLTSITSFFDISTSQCSGDRDGDRDGNKRNSGIIHTTSSSSSIATTKERKHDLSFHIAPGDPSGKPIYKLTDVALHDTMEDGIWVVYKDGVYDITKFIKYHPGGSEKILQAAGQSVVPFWEKYRQHYNTRQVLELLAPMRIGSLDSADVYKEKHMPLGRPSASGMLPEGLDPDFKQKLHDLRRNIWIGGAKGLIVGSWMGFMVYAISKLKRFKHLEWGKNHRMAGIMLGGSLGSMLATIGTGRAELAVDKDINFLIKDSLPNLSSYSKVLHENQRAERNRIENSYHRRKDVLSKKKQEGEGWQGIEERTDEK